MAYQRTAAEHAFIRIEKDMKEGKIPSVVLLCGREQYLTDHYASVLMERFTEAASRQMDLEILSGAAVTTQAVETGTQTVSLLSERRVICLPGFVDRRGRFPKPYDKKQEDFGALADVLGRVPEGVLVLLTAERPLTTGDYQKQSDGRNLKKLRTAVTKAGGTVYEFDPLDDRLLKSFAAKRFMNAGKNISPGALRRILTETGYGSKYTEYDLYTLENDLKKIIAHSGSRELVTEEDLEGTMTVSPENNVFRMLDAISRGRKDQALIYLNTLLEDGEAAFGILGQIVRQLELMLTARELQEEGNSRSRAESYLKKELRVAEFRAKNICSAAAGFRTEHLKAMLLQACQVEENVKTGMMGDRLALEYFIATV